MNRIYRTVWNRVTGTWAVASELARSRGSHEDKGVTSIRGVAIPASRFTSMARLALAVFGIVGAGMSTPVFAQATGTGAVASGSNSAAYGASSTASAGSSSAYGVSSTASGIYGTALGANSTASATYSTAAGHGSNASGTSSG